MKHDMLKEALAALRASGIKLDVRQGRHLQVRWTDHTGRRQLLVMSRSPSDWRAIYQNRAILRRLLERRA